MKHAGITALSSAFLLVILLVSAMVRESGGGESGLTNLSTSFPGSR